MENGKLIEKLFKEGYSARKIGRELGIDFHKVAKFLNEQGYKLLSNRQKGELFAKSLDWDSIIKDYNSGLSMKNIGKKYGIKYDVVREHLIKLGVEIRSVRESRAFIQKYTHTNIFEPLTEEGAYLLGWILSDGSIGSKLKTVKVMVSKDDAEHVDYLRSLITDAPLSEYKHSIGFHIATADLHESLVKLGVSPRKSFVNYDINWDLIMSKHYPYLLLGLYEGDGSISKTNSVMSLLLPSNLYESIKRNIFDRIGGINPRIYEVKDNKYGLLNIVLDSKDYYNVGTYMYANTKKITPLPRKFSRFISQTQRVANSKSPYRHLAIQSLNSLKV